MSQRDDAPHVASDLGTLLLAVRRASATDDVSADGDYAPLHVDANGALRTTTVSAAGAASTLVDDAAFTPGTSVVTPVGFEADETSTDSVDEGDIGAARMTLDRKIIVNTQPHTTGGLTWHKTVSAASTNATNVKASAGNVYFVHASNVNAAVRYLKLYNLSGTPTVGTDTPSITLLLPSNGNAIFAPAEGISFPTGIAFALTTEATDAGSTGVSASEHVIHIGYK